MGKPDYKFKEDKVLEEIRKYIDFTYTQHYGQGRIQATEFIFDTDHGEGFCVGNILKYAQRYGKKDGKNAADLLSNAKFPVILSGAGVILADAIEDCKNIAEKLRKTAILIPLSSRLENTNYLMIS